MNDRHVRRQVLDTITKVQVISNGNVVGTLVGKTKVNGASGRNSVLDAIDTLQRSGHIGVVLDSAGGIDRVFAKNPSSKIKERKEAFDRTESSPEANRQSMYAREYPAYLPDSMCSPVTIIKREDRQVPTPNDMPAKIESAKKADTETATEVSAPVKLPILELLNLAYTGLLCRANPKTGLLPIGSVFAFIKEDLREQDPSDHQIKRVNKMLADLGLRSSVVLGSSAKNDDGRRVVMHQSTIDPNVHEITQERLDALKSSPEMAKEVDEVPAVEPAAPVASNAPDETVASPGDVTKKLVKIIKGLERDNQKVIDDNYRLTGELDAERTRNSKLTNEIARLKATTVDPETASILEKYNKS